MHVQARSQYCTCSVDNVCMHDSETCQAIRRYKKAMMHNVTGTAMQRGEQLRQRDHIRGVFWLRVGAPNCQLPAPSSMICGGYSRPMSDLFLRSIL